MADIRIKDLTTTASSTASDDFIAVDGTTNGTRKLSAFSPTFGGNATVTGTLTVSGATINTSGTNAAVKSTDGAVITKVQSVVSTPIGIVGTESNHDLGVYTNNTNRLNISAAGVVAISGTTASTTTSSGALVVGNGTSGGLGVGGSINAGGNIVLSPASVAASGEVGNLRIADSSNTNRKLFFGLDNTVSPNGVGYIQSTLTGTTTIPLQLQPLGGSLSVGNSGTVVTLNGTTASTSTSSGALVVSGGVGVAGNTNIGGVASVGGSSSAAVGVYVINTALTGTDQYGVASEPIWTSAANLGHTLWARTKTAASAFTLTAGHGVFVEIPTLGAGSAITNNYGVRINNQGTTGVTNAYGLYVASQSGASTLNYAIYTAGGRINFQGLPTSSAGLPAGTLWNDSGTLKVA